MFSFAISFNAQKPLYEQLYEHIRRLIHDQALKPGDKLPSKRVLARELGLGVQTVVSAYEQLIAEGYLEAREKSGYFISSMPAVVISDGIKKTRIAKRTEPKRYLYDFKTSVVDPEHFPYLEWARLEKDVILDDMRSAINNHTQNGYQPLLEEIARYIHRYRGIVTDPDNIVIGSGSESLIEIIRLLVEKGTVAIENPGYPKTSKIYALNNLDTLPIALDDWGINPLNIHDDSVSLIHVTPSHQFPTGKVMPVSRRLELLDWSRQKPDRYLIEDDYDSEFRFTGKPIPALAGLEGSEKVIYLNSFTKSIAPSIRISFMVLPKQLKARFESDYPFYTCPVSLISQVALNRFMSKGSFERHLNRMKKIYRTKRDYLINLLNDLPFKERFRILGEEAGLHFLLKFDQNVSEKRLVDSAGANGVRVYGISEYLIADLIHEPTIIIGYSALSMEDIKKAVQRLGTAWAWLEA